MIGFEKPTNTFKDFRQKQKEREKQQSYLKDLNSLLKEPTKGNAIRIVSKRVVQYIFKVGGGPGTIIKSIYGKVIDHFIDALYYYDKEVAVKDKLELLVKNGIEAKSKSIKGIKTIVEENLFIKNKHMPTVWRYCLLMGMQDAEFARSINNQSFKLQENTKRRIKSFDSDILYFLAIDSFIKSIPSSIMKMKRELQDPSNAIENAIRVLNLHTIELITLDTALHNFSSGLGSSIDNYIKLRNSWAMWVDLPAMTRTLYEEKMLPELNTN